MDLLQQTKNPAIIKDAGLGLGLLIPYPHQGSNRVSELILCQDTYELTFKPPKKIMQEIFGNRPVKMPYIEKLVIEYFDTRGRKCEKS